MILGVLSDTHGNHRLMFEVADLMRDTLEVTTLFHLGDDYDDAEQLAYAGYDVRKVPGLWCSEYHDGRIPNCLLEEFDGVTVAAAHADKDLRARERAAATVLTGHTHQPRIEKLGRSLYVNPGHLKSEKSRDCRPSFATIAIDETHVRAAIHRLDAKVRLTKTVLRSELG